MIDEFTDEQDDAMEEALAHFQENTDIMAISMLEVFTYAFECGANWAARELEIGD